MEDQMQCQIEGPPASTTRNRQVAGPLKWPGPNARGATLRAGRLQSPDMPFFFPSRPGLQIPVLR
eukprot:201034-Alexandrium_andersonii.AAC.1